MTEPVGSVMGLVPLTSATVPEAPALLNAPVMSGVGRAAPDGPELALPWMRKLPLAAIEPVSGIVLLEAPVPAAERYCSESPLREIAASVGL